jgi:hypothetical protein
LYDVVVGVEALDKGTPTPTSEHVDILHLLAILIRLPKAIVCGRLTGTDGIRSGSAPGEGVEPSGGGFVGSKRLIKELWGRRRYARGVKDWWHWKVVGFQA